MSRTRKLLEAAIERYGSEAKLGAAIGYTQNAVHQAKVRGTVTYEMATVLELVAGINRDLLCPERAMVKRRLNGHALTRKRAGVIRSKRHKRASAARFKR